MKECWYQNPGARLTALRIKKTLANLEVEKPHIWTSGVRTQLKFICGDDVDKVLEGPLQQREAFWDQGEATNLCSYADTGNFLWSW